MTTTANEKFRNEIKGHMDGAIQTDDDGDPKEPGFLSAEGPACPADLISLYRHLEKEQDSFQRPQPTLRHTFTFSQSYNYGAAVIQRAFGNVNRIVTPAQLLNNSTVGEPSLDAAMNTSLANIHNNMVPTGVSTSTHQQLIDGINHQWGWLKGAPKVLSEGRRNVTVTQEWKLELWSTWAYDIAS